MLHPTFQNILRPFFGAVNSNDTGHITELLPHVPEIEGQNNEQDFDDLGGDAA